MADEAIVDEPKSDDADAEFEAMRSIYAALKKLSPDGQERVLDYVLKRLGLKREVVKAQDRVDDPRPRDADPQPQSGPHPDRTEDTPEEDDGLEGVSAVAKKWMKRNGLNSSALSQLFSLGVDEIDLVAQGVPGSSMREKQRSVVLLQGLAGLLSTGVARVTDQKLREACTHYGAYDQKNYATYLRDWGAEVSGSKESGYTLTTRGLAAAAGLVKDMTKAKGAQG